MTETESPTGNDRARFHRTLVRVLVVQALALAFLALLQIVYGS